MADQSPARVIYVLPLGSIRPAPVSWQSSVFRAIIVASSASNEGSSLFLLPRDSSLVAQAGPSLPIIATLLGRNLGRRNHIDSISKLHNGNETLEDFPDDMAYLGSELPTWKLRLASHYTSRLIHILTAALL